MDNYTKDARMGVRIQAPVCDRQMNVDLSSDFSLSDYQPEIKRLLRVRAVVSPPDKYVGVGSAELSGAVDYCILYAGNDGALYSATHTEEYSFSVPVEMTSEFDLGDGLVCDAEIQPEAVVGRVASPRKLALRCKLRADVRLYGTRSVEASVDSEEERALQRLCTEAACAQVFTGIGDAFALEDEILFDAQWSDLRVISAEGQVLVNEASAGSGCVNCRGEVYLKLLCCHENGDPLPTVQQRKLPFTQSVLADGCEVNCDCTAHGVCSDLHVTVEDGRVLCEVNVKLQVRAQRNEDACFTRDLYSTASEGEVRYTELALPRAIRCVNGNFSLNKTVTLEELGIRAGASVIDVSMQSGAISLEREHGKFYLTGRCRCHLILSEGDDLCAQEFEVPFRYELDGADCDAVDYDAVVEPVSCRVRVDGERLSLDSELAVSASIRGESRVRVLSEAHFGEPVKHSTALYTVCYPSKEDTLWSIAKKYHRPINTVADLNSLPGAAAADSPDSLAGVAYLLV